MKEEVCKPCPDNAVLNVAGEHFPCETMDQMSEDSVTHEGWAHSNQAAQAIWSKDEGAL